MDQLFPLILGFLSLFLGIILGYFTRQSIAKRDWQTIEAKIQKRIEKVKEEANSVISEARKKASLILEKASEEEEERKRELFRKEKFLLRKENILEEKFSDLEKREKEFSQKLERLKEVKKELENLKVQLIENLERVSKMTKEEAKEELFANLEREYQKDILERLKKLEIEGQERFQKRAREILTLAIQKNALSLAQEITTTVLTLPNEEIKGKIIGKEGRNIRALEGLTGVEIIIDETPEIVVISSFDPIRRQIAKSALEKLIQDGRIQPAKIEEKVEEAKEEINSQIKEAAEQAVYELGLVGINPKLLQLLGRLKFRTSYGQNVLSHSMEVAYLAEALAVEIGADPLVCKKAGLFHDIGKALDHQIEGSHTEIGIKILEKFGIEKEVITAMKSHHEEYPYQSIEAILVQVADQISGARPGARKDTLENYLKRLSDLENIALSFPGVKKAWALQAGREIRVFVNPEEIDDLTTKKLAKDIANRIQEELKYPGEIKINVIREMRVVEYAH